MSMYTSTKNDTNQQLVDKYLQGGGVILTAPQSKAEIKTFLNRSNRGAKSRTLRSQGYAKGNG